jgi:Flp pilus assembly pilin Flp
MLASFSKFLRSRKGNISIEFGLTLPFLALMLAGTVEYGRLIQQKTIVEKAVHAGALLAARSSLPLDAAQLTVITNVIQTGGTDGSGPFLVDGWGDGAATITIDDSSTVFNDVSGVVDLPVIIITVSVPFDPLMPGLMSNFGFNNLKVSVTHEQAYLGS